LATTRYLLRALGRPTPFGLFAGVAAVSVGGPTHVQWGTAHRAVARPDTQWLADIIDRLEAQPPLVERLDVVATNLAVRRGRQLEAPRGPGRIRVRYTSAVRLVRDAAASPVGFAMLRDKLADTFSAEQSDAAEVLTELVRRGILITCLRAPFTEVDPLAYLIARLHEANAGTLPSVAGIVGNLEALHAELYRHNQDTAAAEQANDHAALTARMRKLSKAGRNPLAVDLLIDCDVQLSGNVADKAASAASALLSLSRHPAGLPAWRDYHKAFCDRYGTGTLVPITEAVNPDTGVGYPAGYPGSVLPQPIEAPTARDERILALAWQCITEGLGEIILTDELIGDLAPSDARLIPSHVEVAARVHATTREALEHGDYTLTVTPARAGGTLTSRFTPTMTGSGLAEVYRSLPVATEGALAAQMSFPPSYPHAENVCRVPAYLTHVLSLGEHRGPDGVDHTIPLDDLAITATRERLYLVSMSRRRVVEPQVLHALALDKQPPPLARFLAHLPRAYSAAFTALDWGPYAERMPYLPRVRYERSIIAPARWCLTTEDLPDPHAGTEAWRDALDQWRCRWCCPDTVELRDDDRALRLALTEPLHTAILNAHLVRHGHAILSEPAPQATLGWLDGHAHEIAIPLVRCEPLHQTRWLGRFPA
jgi:hypothetical protein